MRGRERGGEGGGRQSHLIANKSQKALKNCCLSFTFQFYKETIFSFHPLELFEKNTFAGESVESVEIGVEWLHQPEADEGAGAGCMISY